MTEVFERDLKVDASLTDVNIQFGLLPALTVAQDNMCEYFRGLGCDGITMIPVCNCFFVLIKTKIKFYDFATWLDNIKATTELVDKSKIRVVVQTDIESNGKKLVTCAHQMCAMDNTERTLRPVSSTLMKDELQPSKECALEFARMSFDLAEEDFVTSHKINVSNLDFYKHTNNLQYVHFMMSMLDLAFVENVVIDDFEIHYIAESRIDDELKLYRRIESDRVLFQINRGDSCITKAVLNYHSK